MIVEHGVEVASPSDNSILGGIINYNNSRIEFRGSGNILYADGDVTLTDSYISFNGNDALIWLSGGGKHDYKLRIDMWRQTAVYFGADNYFNGVFTAIASERKNIIIGKKGIFSFGVWVRTADPHLLYDSEELIRINPSKSVVIGDHVWLGQNVLLLKGCRLGSGSVIAANCVLSGKKTESNTIYAGNPGKKIRNKVFFKSASVHNYTDEQTASSMKADKASYVYGKKGNALDIGVIDDMLSGADSAQERLDIVRSQIAGCNNKDRFYIGNE